MVGVWFRDGGQGRILGLGPGLSFETEVEGSSLGTVVDVRF